MCDGKMSAGGGEGHVTVLKPIPKTLHSVETLVRVSRDSSLAYGGITYLSFLTEYLEITRQKF